MTKTRHWLLAVLMMLAAATQAATGVSDKTATQAATDVSDDATDVREKIRLSDGWKFCLGHAADPQKDFGCGTEYFNYLTKANSIHNEGPYSPKFDDRAWQDVRVPHDWAAQLPYAREASHSHGYKTVGWRYPATSVGWYRKHLALPASDEGRRLMLQFDGIFRHAQVWFNGFWLGEEPSGYATQVYDVTEYANVGGDNLICVRADASLEEGWFYEGAGIYRDAWLLKTSAVSVAPFGTFAYADLKAPYDQAAIHVETQLTNASLQAQTCQLQHRLLDADGREVARTPDQTVTLHAKQTLNAQRSTLNLNSPRLWSPDDPYIYKVETTVRVDGRVTDVYQTPIGVRDICFDADRGFLLNGRSLKLKGFNMHQDHAGVGAAMPEALMEWRIRQLKQMGCNAYRASHNPMTPAQLDICDRLGMLVIDENRLSGINDEHLRLLDRMIRRDRNHPSIILWSCGNEEWGMENTQQGRRIAEAMRAHVRLMDPTRPSTLANAGGTELIKGVDVVGYNYIAQNDVENRRRQHPEWKVVGTEETTGCGTRGVYFNEPDEPGRMVSMNRDTTHHHMENVIERGWRFYAEHPWAAGCFFWTGFDYRGEPNPLEYPAHESEFGVLDYCGFWKDEAWYLKSWWTDEPTLHIFPHWNLQGHEGEEIELWAYSNCDEVELTVNGKRLGRQPMPRYGHLKWKAVYQPGRVVATGYKQGRRVMTQTIETTKPADRIRLTADRQQLTADGLDVAIVTVEILDPRGRLVPDACPALSFRLEGEATILGCGNGDPAYLGSDHPDRQPCREFSIPAFNGRAQVLVQGGRQSGTATLTCTSGGLKQGELTIQLQ